MLLLVVLGNYKNMNIEKISEHLWKYFEIHSQQRLTLFNYYIAVSGALISAIGFCLQAEKDFRFLEISLSILLSIFSFLFYKLDQRTSFLIKRSEKSLKKLEEYFELDGVSLFSNDEFDLENENKKRFFNKILTYGFIFKIAYFIIGFLSVVFVFYISFGVLNG